MRKNLFLYLALVCFLGLIALFIVDGYLGVYDTIYITIEGQEQDIDTDSWSRDDGTWYTDITHGEEAFFRYEVDNRRFQSYSANVEVSLWRTDGLSSRLPNQEKVKDLISQQLEIASFDKGQVEWVLDTSELEANTAEQFYMYTIIIKRGELERRISLFLNQSTYPEFAIPTK